MSWNLGVFGFYCSSRKKLMETSPKVAVVIPKDYGVISQHYGIISHIINFPGPWQNSFPTIFAAHGLAESMEKRSFVLFRVLRPPLCQSSVCMVSHSSTALTTIDLWQRHFWMSCVKNSSGLRQKKTPFGNPALFCTQHLSRYIIYCNTCMYNYMYII